MNIEVFFTFVACWALISTILYGACFVCYKIEETPLRFKYYKDENVFGVLYHLTSRFGIVVCILLYDIYQRGL